MYVKKLYILVHTVYYIYILARWNAYYRTLYNSQYNIRPPSIIGTWLLYCTRSTVQLGSVWILLSPKIKSREKYLFSHAPKHTIGNCSSRYVQIRCNYKIGQFLQKLKILKSKIFYWLFNCTQKRCATIQNLQIYFFLQNLDLLWLCI